VASACGSILKRIFSVFASSARLTLLHMPSGIACYELADGTTSTRMAFNGAATGNDHVTRSGARTGRSAHRPECSGTLRPRPCWRSWPAGRKAVCSHICDLHATSQSQKRRFVASSRVAADDLTGRRSKSKRLSGSFPNSSRPTAWRSSWGTLRGQNGASEGWPELVTASVSQRPGCSEDRNGSAGRDEDVRRLGHAGRPGQWAGPGDRWL
jgi:hypothetical protein